MLNDVVVWIEDIGLIGLYAGLGLLGIEIAKDLLTKRFAKPRFLETLSSLGTQIPFYGAELATVGVGVTAYYALHQNVALLDIPVTGWSIALAILAADFLYYWEHRLSHRVRLLWVAHAVHHSAPIMNTSVAFRLSVFDPLISLITHAPLVLLGFDPLVVFLSALMVLNYQTWIHTEMIGRLGVLDGLVNTPANHRVHHGADTKYLDKNFGGILMVWDHMFGTYQREEERPTYGLTVQINTVNPLKVWFSEVPRLARDLAGAPTWGAALGYVFRPPGWRLRENNAG